MGQDDIVVDTLQDHLKTLTGYISLSEGYMKELMGLYENMKQHRGNRNSINPDNYRQFLLEIDLNLVNVRSNISNLQKTAIAFKKGKKGLQAVYKEFVKSRDKTISFNKDLINSIAFLNDERMNLYIEEQSGETVAEPMYNPLFMDSAVNSGSSVAANISAQGVSIGGFTSNTAADNMGMERDPVEGEVRKLFRSIDHVVERSGASGIANFIRSEGFSAVAWLQEGKKLFEKMCELEEQEQAEDL